MNRNATRHRTPTAVGGTARGRSSGRGFTLLEFLIYIGIISMVLVTATLFAAEFVGIELKASQYRSVQRAAGFAADRVAVEVREASSVDVAGSAFADPGVLSLHTTAAADDPTVFSVTDGVLYVQQGTGTAEPLTPPDLEVRHFTVDDRSVANRTRMVRVTLTVGARSTGGFKNAEAESTVYVSGRVRAGDGFSN